MFNRKTAFAWLPALAWMMVILLLTLPPPLTQQVGPEIPHFDKVAHFGAFFIQSALVWLAGRRGHAWSPSRCAWTAFAVATLFGALDEGLQAFRPGRSCDALDWLADALGAALAAFLFRFAPRRANR